mmetsp:Transcript_40796/g.97252  ORF Transcript_40796/g.97252 Transcript_40796/m.97252 type:complete len:219 (-) Transcript_40796:121-777(-)
MRCFLKPADREVQILLLLRLVLWWPSALGLDLLKLCLERAKAAPEPVLVSKFDCGCQSAASVLRHREVRRRQARHRSPECGGAAIELDAAKKLAIQGVQESKFRSKLCLHVRHKCAAIWREIDARDRRPQVLVAFASRHRHSCAVSYGSVLGHVEEIGAVGLVAQSHPPLTLHVDAEGSAERIAGDAVPDAEAANLLPLRSPRATVRDNGHLGRLRPL